ncbi:hypothetical protein Hdeb2414_s0013g00408791 [Helianthus debilis subsp. tardiflorus]
MCVYVLGGCQDRLQDAVEYGDGPDGVGRWSGTGGRQARDVPIQGGIKGQ